MRYRAGHRWAWQAQSAVVARARRLAVQLPPTTGVVVEGDPAAVLARAGEGAACIVLGRCADDPGSGAYSSTRERCAAITPCPIVVVPESTSGMTARCHNSGARPRRPGETFRRHYARS